MADNIFSSQLSEPDTSFVRPTPSAGVANIASQIRQLGAIAEEGITQLKQHQLASDLNEKVDSLLQEDEGLDVVEIGRIKDLKTKIEVLKRQADLSGRATEFKTRAEAVLQEAINEMPTAANRFRQTFNAVMGRPEISAKLQGVAEAGQTAQEVLQKFDQDAQRSFGLTPGEIFTPEGQELYKSMADMRRKVVQLNLQKQLLEANGSSPQDMEGPLFKSIPAFRSEAISSINKLFADINSADPEFGFKSLSDVKSLQQLDKLSPEKRALVAARVREIRDMHRSQLIQNFAPTFSSQDKRELFLDEASAPFDDIIAMLDGTKSSEIVQTKIGIYKAQLQGELDPKIAAAMSELTEKGIVADNVINAEYVADLSRFLIGAKDGVNLFGDVGEDPEKRKAIVTGAVKSVNHLMSQESVSTEQAEEASTVIGNILTSMAEGTGVKVADLDGLVTALNDPATSKAYARFVNTDPAIGEQLNETLSRHVGRTVNTLNSEYDRQLSELISGNSAFLDENGNPVQIVRPVITNGVIQFKIDEEAKAKALEATKKIGGSVGPHMANKLNNKINRLNSILNQKYGKRINDTIAATANITGIPREEAAKKLLKDTAILPSVSEATVDFETAINQYVTLSKQDPERADKLLDAAIRANPDKFPLGSLERYKELARRLEQ